MKLLPTILHRRTYVIVTFMITLPMLLFAWINTYNAGKLLMLEKEKQLTAIVNELQFNLQYPYDTILAQEGALQSLPAQKREVLHKRIQPIVNALAKKYPGYGIGCYHPEFKIVAMEPDNPDSIGAELPSSALQVYRDKSVVVHEMVKKIEHGGVPLLVMDYPLFSRGELTGHVWANTLNDINREIYVTVGRNLAVIFLSWLAIIAVIRWFFSKIDRSLAEFAYQVESDEIHAERLHEFPQLVAILEIISSLRQTIKKEYDQKEKINLELAKLDRLELISQMAAGVAHEIRNPMTVVMGYIQRMSQQVEQNRKIPCNLMLEELKRIDGIISDFLSLARNKPMGLSKQQINTIISGIYPLIHADAASKNIAIHLRLDASLIELECNKKEITQLILNLCRNSIEAMEDRGQLVIATLNKKSNIELLIEDTGYGISPEKIEKIFDPFFTTKENCTGLGLAVCRGIVKRHGGIMKIESIEGKGTTCIVKFPVKR
ncbi:hypothetical protein P22_0954 [Propionispora sp. 2/2-37]|uniref:two-component system sensor histidine kinase NtrB n=1 Tax=Propionispora sp. 2/2-37 TaxID=1677858 RepID=UPI0006BB84AD|nr:ATP-binding protein [Propionispora sp. 2/2-37]CUH94888.1 hypothetical protein P22_0954 [Propionispora sp. 2/2-37]